jgi:hypothetical protein
MKATSLLRDQHRRIAALLGRIGNEQQHRLSLVLQLVEELMTHLALEDHVFLCRLADATGMRAETYRENQAQVRNAVLQAVFAEDDDVLFAVRLMELATAFKEHARIMDRDVFPLADTQLDGDDLETMGTRMQTHWNAAIHGDVPPLRPPEQLAAE